MCPYVPCFMVKIHTRMGISAGKAISPLESGSSRRQSGPRLALAACAACFVFGALQPKTGEVYTASYTRRRLVNWIDFLEQVEAWISKDVEHIYAVLDNLTTH